MVSVHGGWSPQAAAHRPPPPLPGRGGRPHRRRGGPAPAAPSGPRGPPGGAAARRPAAPPRASCPAAPRRSATRPAPVGGRGGGGGPVGPRERQSGAHRAGKGSGRSPHPARTGQRVLASRQCLGAGGDRPMSAANRCKSTERARHLIFLSS